MRNTIRDEYVCNEPVVSGKIPTPIAPIPARIRTIRKGLENFSRKMPETIMAIPSRIIDVLNMYAVLPTPRHLLLRLRTQDRIPQ